MTSKPRFLVVGLGGIGGIVAAHLLESGQDVTPLTSNEKIRAALDAEGFHVTGEGTPWRVNGGASAEVPDSDRFDFILLATQPPQVEAAAEQNARFLAPGGAMVVFQNGLCEERIARMVGADRVIGGIIAWGASMVAPGRYDRTSKGGFTLGTLNGPVDDRCRKLAAALKTIGPVDVTDNLRGARWSKLAMNCAVSTIGTVGGDRVGPLLQRSFVRRLGLEVVSEAVRVAKAEGVRLEKLSGTVDLERLALTDRDQRGGLALWAKHAVLLAAGFRYRRLRSSMLAAIERGRPPAVDFLNGEIVTRAAARGLAVPVNARLQQTVHRIAQGAESSSVATLRQIYDDTRS